MTQVLTLPRSPKIAVSGGVLAVVYHAVSELRRGGFVAISATGNDCLVLQAAESVTPQSLCLLARLSDKPVALALTMRRAIVLGLFERTTLAGSHDPKDVVLLQVPSGLEAEHVLPLAAAGKTVAAECLSQLDKLSVTFLSGDSAIGAAVRLVKLARLLPAAIIAQQTVDPSEKFAVTPLLAESVPLCLKVEDIHTYDRCVARTLRQVSEAHVPLAGAENVRLIAFRPGDGGLEHIAIIIGMPDRTTPVLVRLHSECFTGDLLDSLRCDCGSQLRGAIAAMTAAGAGVLLYLAQEGRGIGLVNKLRAYQLQDSGLDTLEANGQLGFDDDERTYLPAAEMLRQLGFCHIRLMTNNPRKVEGLIYHGIDVKERVPHIFPSNAHNLSYIHTKATKGEHLF